MFGLYVDNYRGFTDTYIPLKDVNFLVGENSTGKTSIMALFALLNSQDFWINQDFRISDFQFGTFSDIVSVDSKDKDHFSIGFIDMQKGIADCSACLMVFEEDGGLPVIRNYNRISGSRILQAEFTEAKVRYTFSSRNMKGGFGVAVRKLFGQWSSQEASAAVYEREIADFHIPRRQSLWYIGHYIRTKRGDTALTFLGKPWHLRPVTWIAPIRTKPRRTYDEVSLPFSAEGAHVPYTVRKITRGEHSRFDEFMRSFGEDSGLYKTVGVHEFGNESTSPFAMEVTLQSSPLNLASVGYGVSQSLPVIVETFASKKGSVFAIQQPEVHLHPKAQAALGDYFFKLAVEDEKRFLIETHSDFTIDRFRMNYRTASVKPESLVLFFESGPNGNTVTPVEILDNGDYSSLQPPAFREFFLAEELELLRMG